MKKHILVLMITFWCIACTKKANHCIIPKPELSIEKNPAMDDRIIMGNNGPITVGAYMVTNNTETIDTLDLVEIDMVFGNGLTSLGIHDLFCSFSTQTADSYSDSITVISARNSFNTNLIILPGEKIYISGSISTTTATGTFDTYLRVHSRNYNKFFPDTGYQGQHITVQW